MPPPASHSDATSPTPGDHRWYYRGPGGTCGPVSTEQMLQDAQRGLLTSQSEVRLGLDGEWIRASTLDGLLAHSPTDSRVRGEKGVPEPARARSELSRVVAECRVYLQEREVKRSDQTALRRSRPQRSAEPLVERLVSAAWAGTAAAGNAVLGVLETLLGAMTAVLPRLSTISRIARSRILWGITTLCIVAAVTFVVYDAATKQRRQAATVEQLASELRALRDRSADDAAWTAFTTRVRERLDRMIPELEESAQAGDRVSIDLLWAARDYLPQMLNDARHERSAAERKFDVCMRRIRIQYESARGQSPVGTNRD